MWKQDFAAGAAGSFTEWNHFAQIVVQLEDPYW